MTQRISLLLLGCLALVSPACSSDSNDTKAPSDGGMQMDGDMPATGVCAGDSGAPPYAAGTSAVSTSGFKATLVSADPAPPARGQNTFVLKIVDPDGKALPDAAVVGVKTWMPKHGHGSADPKVTRKSDGSFEVSPIIFSMAGIWEVRVSVATGDGAADGGTDDIAVFTLCIE